MTRSPHVRTAPCRFPITSLRAASAVLSLVALGVPAAAQVVAGATQSAPNGPVELLGPGSVTVRSAFGGFILGYDVDQNGKLGVLAEAVTLEDGTHDVAVETFDQRTGQIVDVVAQQEASKNDFVALGVAGTHTGLVEFEHVTDLFVDQRVYLVMNPLASNAFATHWTPPLTTVDTIAGVTRTQGVAETAFLAAHNSGGGSMTVFASNVAANTFGPSIPLTHPNFQPNHSPVIALDEANHRAILAALGNNPFGPPTLGKVDLGTGATTTFTGIGIGYVNGLAVDSATGVACTATEIDFRIEIYDLAAQTGFTVVLPNALSQAHSGKDVQVDTIHKLFFVGQPISSTAPGSSIHVFDEQGHLVKSINGLKLPASPGLIALSPHFRTGFVIKAPDLNELQTFTY